MTACNDVAGSNALFHDFLPAMLQATGVAVLRQLGRQAMPSFLFFRKQAGGSQNFPLGEIARNDIRTTRKQ